MWGNIDDPRENMYGEFMGYSPKNIALGYKDLQKKNCYYGSFFKKIFLLKYKCRKNVPDIVT